MIFSYSATAIQILARSFHSSTLAEHGGRYLAKNFGIDLTTSKNRSGNGWRQFRGKRRPVFVGRTRRAQPRSLTQQVGEFQNYVDNDEVTSTPPQPYSSSLAD
jgi:hypothetical protein